MIFAILGLRSLYFVLIVLTKYLVHLEKAVVFVLFFISVKMFLHAYQFYTPKFALPDVDLHITPSTSMTVVLSLLTIGIVASLIFPGEDEDEEDEDEENKEA